MRSRKIVEGLGLRLYNEGDLETEISKAVVGDLLSFVMGYAPEGALWLTIQTHLNLAAVAVLKEFPMILIASGRTPACDLVERCGSEKITLAGSEEPLFPLCGKLYSWGLGG